MITRRAADAARSGVVRQARPLLGTLVEIGVARARPSSPADAIDGAAVAREAIAAAFLRVAQVESSLSRFDPRSSIGRFNDAGGGAQIEIGEDARVVLQAAGELFVASDGLFDISLGSGGDGWSCDGSVLRKLRDGVRLDLGGIAKGHAVDVAVTALRECGVEDGWVNAGGDLRVFGALALPIDLRDEELGGVRRFAVLEDGAFATSWIAAPEVTRNLPRSARAEAARHASVAAHRCLWADALTKIVALAGDARHPLVAAHYAHAWLH